MEPPAAWQDANSARVRITECRGARFWSRSMLPTTAIWCLTPGFPDAARNYLSIRFHRNIAVWPKYSCRTAVVLKQAAEPLSTADCLRRCNLARGRHWEQQHIAHTLMVSFLVKVFQELGYDTP